ncbi:MAG: endonuclease III [Eubacteriales bacterium]|nr:endonuclease III [Eubacteriales bacterium]
MSNEKATEILDILRDEYPDAGCALHFRNAYELIVCVVLSAQTTDVSVNRISEELFNRYPDPESLADASQDDVAEIIRTIGMYRTKSKNIIALAGALCEKHGGRVPENYDELVKLPGVGRKTANVVLAVGFGQQRIAVDTHVFRVSRRIGLAGNDAKRKGSETKGAGSAKAAGSAEVLATELELMNTLPEDRWTEAHHSILWHGRKCCTARNPKCDECVIKKHCRKNI